MTRPPVSPSEAAVQLRDIARGLDIYTNTAPPVVRVAKDDGESSIYLGGPVDYADPHDDPTVFDWRHDLMWPFNVWWCPPCKGLGKDPAVIMEQNWRALARAKVAVFDLSQRFHSIGTPIEAWAKVHDMMPGQAVILVHDSDRPGLFIQEMAARGAIIVPDYDHALRAVQEVVAAWKPS